MQDPTRPRVLCTVPTLPDDARQILLDHADVDFRPPQRDMLLATLGRYDAWWLHFDTRCDAELLARAPALTVVATATTGSDHIDKVTAARAGVRVLCTAADRGLLERFTATTELA